MGVHHKYRIRYALRLVLLFVSLLITAGLFLKGMYMLSLLLLALSAGQAYLLYKLVILPFTELEDFASAARYRDFSAILI
ncbi:hypothetical protein KRR40_45605 [Niabella defluvii]|nr:hypothetical protein KRR40_45605 [Niabella sp. I65]